MHSIVKKAPFFNDDLSLQDAQKIFLVQAFISQSIVKTLHMTILPGASWINIERPNSQILKPTLNLFCDELGSIITPDALGHTTLTHYFTQCIEDITTSEPSLRSDGQALTGIFIDEGQELQRNSILSAGVHKVPAPDLIHRACFGWECC
jgi:hypothetical protein